MIYYNDLIDNISLIDSKLISYLLGGTEIRATNISWKYFVFSLNYLMIHPIYLRLLEAVASSQKQRNPLQLKVFNFTVNTKNLLVYVKKESQYLLESYVSFFAAFPWYCFITHKCDHLRIQLFHSWIVSDKKIGYFYKFVYMNVTLVLLPLPCYFNWIVSMSFNLRVCQK